MKIKAKGINDAWLQVVNALATSGGTSSPRGFAIKEIKNMSVEIENPKKRILSLPIRNISLPFAFGELIWYLSARNDVEMMEYYSKKMRSFSDDGKTLNSAYGYRIFGRHPQLPFNQWDHVVNQLKMDPDTRQAIIHLHTPNNQPTKDEVCTLTLQFMIRDGKLDMITNMRSNDIVWGFTYDVFSFTTFQELMANELGVEIGTYYHNAASMHIYERDFHYFDHLKIYDILIYMCRYDMEFDYDGLTVQHGEWDELVELEDLIRTTQVVHYNETGSKALDTMVDIFNIYAAYKNGGEHDALFYTKYDNIYHLMMRQYLTKKSLNDSSMVVVEGCDGAGKTTYIDKLDDGSIDVIAFGKRPDDFSKLIYFNTALLTGRIVLDRFYLSEWVYGRKFRGESILSRFDVLVLDELLTYRNAHLVFVNTDPETCYKRLDAEDSKFFSLEDIQYICESYEISFRVSGVKNKIRLY